MEKIINRCGVAASALLIGLAVLGAFTVPSFALSAETNDPDVKTVPVREVDSTFRTELDETNKTSALYAGNNVFLAGNNLRSEVSADRGLLFAAGNAVELEGEAEYGFAAGNTVKFAGRSERDLFLAGNEVIIAENAAVGRDIYAAGNIVSVKADVAGDLNVAATEVVIAPGVEVSGNVNLSANKITFGDGVEILGELRYNDVAEVSNLQGATYARVETYHADEPETFSIAEILLAKVWSAAMLFFVVAVLGALYHGLQGKIATEASRAALGKNLVLGLAALILTPVLAVACIITLVGAPLGLILGALYVAMIYLSQGFAGVWLGHLIAAKVLKREVSFYAEAFCGILVLAVLSLSIVGGITGFLGLLLGMGLIVNCLKPSKKVEAKVSASFSGGKAKSAKKPAKKKA